MVEANALPAGQDDGGEEQWEESERVLDEGDVEIKISCVVSSMAGSGSAAVLEFKEKWYTHDDVNGLSGPFVSWEQASDEFGWWMIHTDGDWSISGSKAEESLHRIDVCGLGDEDEPLLVEVNGEEWCVTKVPGSDTFLWRAQGG